MASDRELSVSDFCGIAVERRTNCPGSRIGSDRRISAFIKLNMAVFAPMPSARERIATPVVTGFLTSIRRLYRMSCPRISIASNVPLQISGGKVAPLRTILVSERLCDGACLAAQALHVYEDML